MFEDIFLPKSYHCPAKILKLGVDLSISCDIFLYLFDPVIFVALQLLLPFIPVLTMPKLTINKDRDFLLS